MARLFFIVGLLALCFTQGSLANLRDPTRPVLDPGRLLFNEIHSWELQAIIIAKNSRMAIFNGQVLRLGSQLSGFKVVAITPNTVHLEGPDGRMTLFLFNQTIKKAI